MYIFIFFLAVPQVISFYWFQEPLIINEMLIMWGHSKFGVFLYLLYTHTHTHLLPHINLTEAGIKHGIWNWYTQLHL